jgi:DNA-binding transcriptional ArsR family regulator
LVVALLATAAEERALSEVGVCMDGRLTDKLAVTLEPKLQDALNHPTRRDILRVLRQKESCSGTAILGELPPLKRGEVVYHLQVLQECGAIFVDGAHPATGGRDRLYQSGLVDDAKVRGVLRATERQDGKRRHRANRAPSSGLLTMFRVPRPERSIRLSNLLGRKTDREE